MAPKLAVPLVSGLVSRRPRSCGDHAHRSSSLSKTYIMTRGWLRNAHYELLHLPEAFSVLHMGQAAALATSSSLVCI